MVYLCFLQNHVAAESWRCSLSFYGVHDYPWALTWDSSQSDESFHRGEEGDSWVLGHAPEEEPVVAGFLFDLKACLRESLCDVLVGVLVAFSTESSEFGFEAGFVAEGHDKGGVCF